MGSEIIAIEEPIVRVLKFMDGNNKPGDFMVLLLNSYFIGLFFRGKNKNKYKREIICKYILIIL